MTGRGGSPRRPRSRRPSPVPRRLRQRRLVPRRLVPRRLRVALIGLACVAALPAATAHASLAPSNKVLYHDGADGRYLLDGRWLLRLDPSNKGVRHGWQNQTSTGGWKATTVPNAWNAGNNSLSSFIGGVAWYRRDFVLPHGSATAWLVRFESVNYTASVWLNGRLLGSHVGSDLPFEFQLVGLRPGINRLVVRTNDQRGATDLPPSGFASSGVPVGGWWNYGGLLREVYIRRVKRVDLSAVVARPLLPCATCAASMSYSTTVTNYAATAQIVTVVASFGGGQRFVIGSARIAAGGRATLASTQPIGHVHLWSIYDPYLYNVVIQPFANGAPAEAYRLAVGVRSITVVDGRLELNYQPLNLRGVGLMEDDPTVGRALSDAQRARQMGWVRSLGAHLIRAHYPMDPYTLELADRYGILVWSEIPVYSIPSETLAMPSVRRLGLSMLRGTIAANGNHPSVAVWSVANELAGTPGAPETTWFDESSALAHQLDPTRPVGAAINGYPSVGCQPVGYAHLQVLGLNDYFGWYPGPDGTIADWDLLGDYLDQAHACYPDKALLITEFGAEANRNGPPEERGTFQFQQAFADFTLGVVESKPYLSGADYWTLVEYKVKPNWNGGNPYPSPPLSTKGLLTFNGVPKPAFYDVQHEYQATQQLLPLGSPPNG